MKKIIIYILIIAVVFSSGIPAFADGIELSAKSAILMCADTGDVLYEQNADTKMNIASITKIMTAILVIENCDDLNAKVKILPECCNIEGSSMYLEAGKKYAVKELLLGMMLASGNDAAASLACCISGDIESFAKLMNEKAQELGMTNSCFKNPHGLDEDGHCSTARDMAVLMSYCMKNKDFCDIASCKSADIGKLTFVNHNKLLWTYEGCIGGKTGYTETAGRTLVSCAERNGMKLVAVTLGAPDDWNDHAKLFDYGYNKYKLTNFSHDDFKLDVPIISGEQKSMPLVPENDILILTEADAIIKARFEIPRLIFAGASKNEKAGAIKVFINGELAVEENLVYTDDVKNDISQQLSLWERVGHLINRIVKPYYIKGK